MSKYILRNVPFKFQTTSAKSVQQKLAAVKSEYPQAKVVFIPASR